MAVIGARPATGPWFLGRGVRSRTRTRQVRRARRGGFARRIASPVDVRPLVVVIVIAAALAVFYLSQSTGVAARGYEIDSLAAQLADRRADQQQLIMAIGEARSPAEITRRARIQLGLVQLQSEAITYATAPETSAD